MRDNSLRGTNHAFSENGLNHRNKKFVKIFVVSIAVIIILGIFSSVVYNAGYIPIKRFMEVKKPIGEADEINIDEHINKHPEIRNFPHIDKLKYKVFGTNRSIEDISEDYKNKLRNEGYKLLYEGVAYRDEIPFEYYGLIKGLTGVGIILTCDENVTLNYKTMVLYTTGSVLDYRKILNWYKKNNDIIGDIYL